MAKDKKKKSGSAGAGDHGDSHSAGDSHGHGAAHHDDHGHLELRDTLTLGKAGDSLLPAAGGLFVIGIGAAVLTGGGLSGAQFQHSYLAAYMWGLSIVLGALFWVTLQHLMNAKWSIVVRRIGEIYAQGGLLMAVLGLPLFLPMFGHKDVLYKWVNHDFMHGNHALHAKVGYLNTGFFGARLAFYFGFWILFGGYLLATSKKQDEGKDPALASKMQGASAPGMILVALTLTFAAFDLLMSLDPIWFSTIFGVYYFATCVLTFMSVLGLSAVWLQSKGILASAITREHYHDIGKMMFGFTAFWTYIAFSQFMLIWYANIPEETHWYHDRLVGNWFGPTLFLAAAHFVIPFFGMMSREVKRNKQLLSAWAVYVLCICWFDMHWLVLPNLHKEGLSLTITDFAAWLGIGGAIVAFVLFRAKGLTLIAKGDPRLKKSLAFENI